MMAALWLVAVPILLLGLAVGSFLNVVIYRLPRGESVAYPGSHCPRCDQAIKARHNVPVLGWLVLRGRCASCHEPISIRYPLVEAGTGVLMLALTLRFGITPALPAWLFFAAAIVTLTMIDVDLRTLPRSLTAGAYVVASVLLVLAAWVNRDWTALGRAGLGALILAGVAAVPHRSSRLRPADAALAGFVGLYAGWLSWPALTAAAALTLIVSLTLSAPHRRSTPCPH